MPVHRFARVVHARPRRIVFFLLLTVLTCLTGVAHAPVVDAPPAHEFAVSADLTQWQQQDSPRLDVNAGSAGSQNTDETPSPLTGDSGSCSVGMTCHDGCLTFSPDHQLAAPAPSSIDWPADAPRPPHPLLRSTPYDPPAPTPGSLSINRT